MNCQSTIPFESLRWRCHAATSCLSCSRSLRSGPLHVHQLVAGLVETNQRACRIWRSMVDIQRLLLFNRAKRHLADKLGVGFRRDDILLPPPRSCSVHFAATLFLPATTFVMPIRPFGIGPVSSHSVHVIRVDQAVREIETEENGQLVTSWNHQMRVETSPGNQSRYTDCIHLKAGLLTPPVWLFACLFCRSRQRRLRTLLAEDDKVKKP